MTGDTWHADRRRALRKDDAKLARYYGRAGKADAPALQPPGSGPDSAPAGITDRDGRTDQ